MYSLDIESMYTSILIELVNQAIEKNWKSIKKNTNIPMVEFIKVVKIILESTNFSFNGNLYTQVQGLAMGQPLSPTIANLVIADIEKTILEKFTRISMYKRYVDDIFLISNRIQIKKIVQAFNDYHPRLKFTLEKEKDRKLNWPHKS